MLAPDRTIKNNKYLVTISDGKGKEVISKVLIGDTAYDVGQKLYDKAIKKDPDIVLEVAPADWDDKVKAKVKKVEKKKNKP